METPTYMQVFGYIDEIEKTGSYSKADMKAILLARFLYGQDWLNQLKDEGPEALVALRKSKQDAKPVRLLFRRIAFLTGCLISWLVGDEFDAAHMIVEDVLDNHYAGYDAHRVCRA